MIHIGQRAPHFRTPALIDGELVYLSLDHWAKCWRALCFMPYPGLVETGVVDHHADQLARLDTRLLIVSSGFRPFHRLVVASPTKSRTPLLADPLGRLHRSFDVTVARMPARCQILLIDRAGILRFHLVHDFNDRGLAALHKMVRANHARDSEEERPVTRKGPGGDGCSSCAVPFPGPMFPERR